jgi:superfamily I DNA/RNA helicase
MMYFVLLIALSIYCILKQYRIYLYRKYELKLYKLRDRLRDLAIEGEIDHNEWTFFYLDSSISKMTDRFKMLNIFHAMYLRNSHENDHQMLDFRRQLHKSLSKNKKLNEIYIEYQSVLSAYLLQKHVILFSVGSIAFYSYIRSKSKIKSWQLNTKDSIQKLTIFPETSTSEDFIRKYKPAYC